MVDKKLFIFVSILITISIIASYSFTTYTTLFYGYGEFHFLKIQFFSGVLAVILMWQLSRLDPTKWAKPIGISLFLISFIAMISMYFLPPNLVTSAGGAKRWIRLPWFSIAPVEFFKVGFVYFLAWSFSRKFSLEEKKTLLEEIKLILPYIFVFLLAVILIAVFQNDLGQVMVLGITLSFMLFFGGRSLKLFITLVGLAFILFILFIRTSEHRINRILSWWANVQNFVLSIFPDAIADKLRVENAPQAYQVSHSLDAISHGGLFGTGIGEGILKLGFLSEVHTDFVMAGIAEELGFLGLFALTIIMVLIIHRIFKIANRSKNRIDYLFSIGVALLIGSSFLINAYGITGLAPIKGIAVPFLSYGGSGMIANSIAIGLVLMISKKALKQEVE